MTVGSFGSLSSFNVILVFLILDFNTFYFIENLPENHVFT